MIPAEFGGAATAGPVRVPPGGRRELGLLAWVFSWLAARIMRIPQMHLFTVLGQHRRLFWPWLIYSTMLLWLGRLRWRDTESVILRVGHLRGCEYELQQHRRMARRRGVDADMQAKVFAFPRADGLPRRDRVLLGAVDELVAGRTLSTESWRALAAYLNRQQLIEFVTLVGQYDALAMTLNTLQVPLDYPE